MLNRIWIYSLLLLTFLIISPAGLVSARGSEAGTVPGKVPLRDTLKVLGSLVESNKVSNNALSVKYAKTALAIAKRGTSVSELVDAYKWVGKAYYENQKDSSYWYYNQAFNIADSCNLAKQKVSIFYNLANLYSASSNFNKAVSMLDSSLRLAELVKDPEGKSNALIALGTIKYIANDFENSRLMYETAFKTAKSEKLYKQMGAAAGNLALSAFEMDTQKRIVKLKEAFFYLTRVSGVEGEMANLLINIGFQYASADSALFYYKWALEVALNANLPQVILGAYNNMAYSYIDKRDIQKAESCIRDAAIPVAIQTKDEDWLASLYDTYADVCVEKKDYKNALLYQRKAKKAANAAYIQKASEQVRLLAAQLDLNSKELIIQNEQKELLLKSNRLRQVELWLVIALSLVLASFLVTFILQQRNREKFQKEQIGSAKRLIEMEETEKGRIARELHDLTGQLVLGISGAIENVDFPDIETKEQIKARIKELGASMRQISHRMNRAMIEHFTFSEMITGLCEDFQKLSRMDVSLEMPEEFPDLPNELVLHFYRITQELLTNAGKYAHESQVTIRIFSGHDWLNLVYSDNGPGFVVGGNTKPSMGVLNIYERAKLVGGKANLTTSPGNGTMWEIAFPINQNKSVKN